MMIDQHKEATPMMTGMMTTVGAVTMTETVVAVTMTETVVAVTMTETVVAAEVTAVTAEMMEETMAEMMIDAALRPCRCHPPFI